MMDGSLLAAVSLAALACSAAALILGIAALVALRRAEADRREMRGARIVQELRRRLRTLREALIERPESEEDHRAFNQAADDLACAYEEACRRYYRRGTDPAWFASMYGRELITWVEEGPRRGSFGRRVNVYPYTARAYREMRRALF